MNVAAQDALVIAGDIHHNLCAMLGGVKVAGTVAAAEAHLGALEDNGFLPGIDRLTADRTF